MQRESCRVIIIILFIGGWISYMLSVVSRFKRDVIMTLYCSCYKSTNGLTPLHLTDALVMTSDVHDRNNYAGKF